MLRPTDRPCYSDDDIEDGNFSGDCHHNDLFPARERERSHALHFHTRHARWAWTLTWQSSSALRRSTSCHFAAEAGLRRWAHNSKQRSADPRSGRMAAPSDEVSTAEKTFLGLRKRLATEERPAGLPHAVVAFTVGEERGLMTCARA